MKLDQRERVCVDKKDDRKHVTHGSTRSIWGLPSPWCTQSDSKHRLRTDTR